MGRRSCDLVWFLFDLYILLGIWPWMKTIVTILYKIYRENSMTNSIVKMAPTFQPALRSRLNICGVLC